MSYLCILVRLTHLNANLKEGQLYLELEKYKSASATTTTYRSNQQEERVCAGALCKQQEMPTPRITKQKQK